MQGLGDSVCRRLAGGTGDAVQAAGGEGGTGFAYSGRQEPAAGLSAQADVGKGGGGSVMQPCLRGKQGE